LSEGDKATCHAVEGMIDGIWIVTSVTDGWKSLWCNAIAEEYTIPPLLSGKGSAFQDSGMSCEPGASLAAPVKAALQGSTIWMGCE
jgi:hypothetical protein